MQKRILDILQNTQKVIIGKERVTKLLLTALLADGHVLLEDVPGTGKTRLAKALAASLGIEFGRIQFTPDMLPADITGLHIYDRESGKFVLNKGPVFTNILLADEICPRPGGTHQCDRSSGTDPHHSLVAASRCR